MSIFQSIKNKITGKKSAEDAETGTEQLNPLYSGTDQAVHENPLYEEAPEPESQPKAEDPLSAVSKALKGSKKGGVRSALAMSGGENSETFQSIVGTIDQINQQTGQMLTGDTNSDTALLFNLSQLYSTLIQNCETYVNRRLVVTAAGKERQQIVHNAYYYAVKDKKALDGAVASIFDVSPDERRGLSIKDLIAEGRMLKFSVNDINAGAGGANASIVYQLQNHGQDYFFKSEENVTGYTGKNRSGYYTPVFEAAYNNIPDDPEHQKLRQNLLNIQSALSEMFDSKPSEPDETLWLSFIKNRFRDAEIECPPDNELQEMLPVVKKICKVSGGNYLTASILSDIGVSPKQGGTSEFNVSRRNVATSRMAELLGVGHLIAHSETAEVTDQTTGRKIRGNLMAKAEGVENEDAERATQGHTSAEVTSGGFQRATICMQMLDNICSQVDRHLKNMMYQLNGGRLTGVQGIDNDLAFGERDDVDNNYSSQHARPAFNAGGAGAEMSIPYMDKVMAQNIIELAGKPETVRFVMNDVLRPEEIDGLISRLSKAAVAIQAAMQADSTKDFVQGNRFLEPGDWDAHRDQIHTALMEKEDTKRFGYNQRTYYSNIMSNIDERFARAQH